MQNKPVLAFDCSTPAANVALAVRGTVHVRDIAHGSQAAELVPTIDDLMREHGITYARLGAILTTVGPGSFTGLRIGLATLHGLVLAVPVPVKTLTSLEAVAWEVARKEHPPAAILVALHAGKGEVFSQSFVIEGGSPRALDDITLGDPQALKEEYPMFGNILPGDSPHYIAGPSAAILCEIAELLPATELKNALPLYIRPPDAKIPRPLPWMKAV